MVIPGNSGFNLFERSELCGRAADFGCPSVCLSVCVCLSIRELIGKTARPILMTKGPYESPTSYLQTVFFCLSNFAYLPIYYAYLLFTKKNFFFESPRVWYQSTGNDELRNVWLELFSIGLFVI